MNNKNIRKNAKAVVSDLLIIFGAVLLVLVVVWLINEIAPCVSHPFDLYKDCSLGIPLVGLVMPILWVLALAIPVTMLIIGLVVRTRASKSKISKTDSNSTKPS